MWICTWILHHLSPVQFKFILLIHSTGLAVRENENVLKYI